MPPIPELPDLASVGAELVIVGNQQKALSKNLKSSSERVSAVSDQFANNSRLATALATIRTSVTTIRGYLAPVANALSFIVNALSDVRVPTVSPRTTSIDIPVVGNTTIVTGINVGSTNPFAGIAQRVNTILTNVNNARETMGEIADGVREFRAEFPMIRQELTRVSSDMNQASTSMDK